MGFDSQTMDRLDALLREGGAEDRWTGWSFCQVAPDRIDIWRGGRIERLELTQTPDGYQLADPQGKIWWTGQRLADMAAAARAVLTA